AWYLTGPLRHLGVATRRLAAGDLGARVTPALGRRRDEIADLGHDFDRMAERLEALVAAQNRLLSDVSHELRSPLARLRVAVELARQQPAETPKALDRIEREAGRLDTLVGQVLTLSRLEAGVDRSLEDYLDVAELLEEIVADADFEARARGRHVTLSVTGEAVVRARGELLHRALENVLRNGVRHTPEGSTVEVCMEAAQDTVAVSVCDRGPGVPEHYLGALFDPFVRADGGDDGRGYGLGLAIARRAIEVHGGTIAACLRKGGGLCVDISLPVEPPDA
ncbi:MAG: ATP-binding protein, partial [Gammaproteobacteria bacterium]